MDSLARLGSPPPTPPGKAVRTYYYAMSWRCEALELAVEWGRTLCLVLSDVILCRIIALDALFANEVTGICLSGTDLSIMPLDIQLESHVILLEILSNGLEHYGTFLPTNVSYPL